MMNPNAQSWTRLTEPKQFSRLLYANPVCLLCSYPKIAEPGDEKQDQQHGSSHDNTVEPIVSRRNVMTVSWLTATNNSGDFLMSINRRRFSIENMCNVGHTFILCVPVRGMESIVLGVGGCSGKWGSKFPHDHGTDATVQSAPAHSENKSNRQKKKLRKSQFEKGVPGLVAVPFEIKNEKESDFHGPFAIENTVARMLCQIVTIVDANGSLNSQVESINLIDDEHILISARIKDAFVDDRYWNKAKNMFHPQAPNDGSSPEPFMSFFGSQAFGYITNN